VCLVSHSQHDTDYNQPDKELGIRYILSVVTVLIQSICEVVLHDLHPKQDTEGKTTHQPAIESSDGTHELNRFQGSA